MQVSAGRALLGARLQRAECDGVGSSTSSAVAWMRSPRRNFCARGNFSTVGMSQSRNWKCASMEGPLRRSEELTMGSGSDRGAPRRIPLAEWGRCSDQGCTLAPFQQQQKQGFKEVKG